MRYFAEIAYRGTAYAGWQVQKNAQSVQQVLQDALSKILRAPTPVTGCGRTDTGVHASQYYFHFDHPGDLPANLISRMNKILPPDIAIYHIYRVEEQANARFDAIRRTYNYTLSGRKDPFYIDRTTFYPHLHKLDWVEMEKATRLLLEYEEFYPFCKSNTDVNHFRCNLLSAKWEWSEERAILLISANRFLRGMVRLIVGMCIQVGRQKLELETVRKALDEQHRLKRAYSAPPEGLTLVQVEYPDGLLHVGNTR